MEQLSIPVNLPCAVNINDDETYTAQCLCLPICICGETKELVIEALRAHIHQHLMINI